MACRSSLSSMMTDLLRCASGSMARHAGLKTRAARPDALAPKNLEQVQIHAFSEWKCPEPSLCSCCQYKDGWPQCSEGCLSHATTTLMKTSPLTWPHGRCLSEGPVPGTSLPAACRPALAVCAIVRLGCAASEAVDAACKVVGSTTGAEPIPCSQEQASVSAVSCEACSCS